MKFNKKNPARTFVVGKGIDIKDCGDMFLESDEQITFKSDESEYDVCKKSWGYYATPSVNGRLKSFNFETYIIMNVETKMKYVFLVHSNKKDLFKDYLKAENLEIIERIDK